MKLHGTATTKELRKHSFRPVGGAEVGDRQPSGDDSWQGSGPHGPGGAD